MRKRVRQEKLKRGTKGEIKGRINGAKRPKEEQINDPSLGLHKNFNLYQVSKLFSRVYTFLSNSLNRVH